MPFLFFLLSLMVPFSFAADTGPSLTTNTNVEKRFVPAHPNAYENWRRTSSVAADVFYAYKDRETAQALLVHANKRIPEIAKNLGVGAGEAMQIYIAPSQKVFSQVQPGSPPEWADGVAYPKEGLIFLRSPDIRDGRNDPLTQVLDHEIVHILLGRAFGLRPVPRWLQEGVAQLEAGEYRKETLDLLSQGLLGQSLMSIPDLARGFPLSGSRARLAYAQSADFTAFLRQRYGHGIVAQLIDLMSSGRSFENSIRIATGKGSADLDTAWRGEKEASFLWMTPLFSDTVFMSFGGFLLLYGFIRLRFRRRAQAQTQDNEEEIHDALAFELSGWDPYEPIAFDVPWGDDLKWTEDAEAFGPEAIPH